MDFLLRFFHGLFIGSFPMFVIGMLVALAIIFHLGFHGAPFTLWILSLTFLAATFGLPLWLIVPFLIVATALILKPIRRKLLSQPLMDWMKKNQILPVISATERTALDAGVVWVEKDFFSGKPDWKKILSEPYPSLSPEEQQFVEGPLQKLCSLLDDWQVWRNRDFPLEAWEMMKKERFWGMIIPKDYGGLGFSATAHSHVIMTLSSHCTPAAVTCMVPNSLGPAELLVHYGTPEQKNYYLPRLARGEEIPCFALTEPGAGSDAGSIQAEGILFKGEDGELYIKLDWDKRWITLAAISTILGLAFRLKDPQNFLGKGEDVGITCALIPSQTKGVVLGKRHDPLGVPFYNCPTQGKDVVVPASVIIGGLEWAGQGWKMLMECLAVGRGISLPAQSTGEAKLLTRATSAHAYLRKQFGVPLAVFEGVAHPLSHMGAWTYLLEAMRKFTLGALDKGIKPPVITAIAKYNATELGRKIINHGMDIMAGKGISLGPDNVIGHHYISAPIAITVEGANILTRTLMIFGQGALRAHPFAYEEVKAVEKGDVEAFDEAFWGHVHHVVRNTFRSFLLSITRGKMAAWGETPLDLDPQLVAYTHKLSWASATFAWLTDLTMGVLGGSLKQKEMLTGRFADILSWMYMGTSVIRRYEAEGRKQEDLPLVHFCLKYALTQIQEAFEGIYTNLELKVPFLSWIFHGPLRFWVRLNLLEEPVSDRLVNQVARLLVTDSEIRNRVCAEGLYIPKGADAESTPLGKIEAAFALVQRTEMGEQKIKLAIKAGDLPKKRVGQLLDLALEKGIIRQEEFKDLEQGEIVRARAIAVDDFSQEEYLRH